MSQEALQDFQYGIVLIDNKDNSLKRLKTNKQLNVKCNLFDVQRKTFFWSGSSFSSSSVDVLKSLGVKVLSCSWHSLVSLHQVPLPRSPSDSLFLPSVGKLVDLCGGDARDDQTRGHDGEARQNFIPHDNSLKLSGDKEQLWWQPSCPTALDSLFC